MSESKPVHVKPSFYTYCFEQLKIIALKYGYNLVIHGSLNRDMDLIAIPWIKDVKNANDMIKEFARYLGGDIQKIEKDSPHGRAGYFIHMCRSGYDDNDVYYKDKQYYLDISIMPTLK